MFEIGQGVRRNGLNMYCKRQILKTTHVTKAIGTYLSATADFFFRNNICYKGQISPWGD